MRTQSKLFARRSPYAAVVLLLLGFPAVTSQAQTFSLPLQLTSNGMLPEVAADGIHACPDLCYSWRR
jgi:hypothetical protein